jgi:hypothetical protein
MMALSAPALADGAEVTATALFDEGRTLMAQHRYAEACPKLAESQRLAPSGGTLINLAGCYEHVGLAASAWEAWKDVAARANAAGKGDVERSAVAHALALEPTLAKLTIGVAPGSDVPGLEVKRDGILLGHAEFGLSIPVDPGLHTVEATAPKKKPWTSQIEVAAKQTDARVSVSLVDETSAGPAAATAPNASPEVAATSPGAGVLPANDADGQSDTAPRHGATSNGKTQQTIGWVGVGVGAAGLIVGSVFGLDAITKNNEAKSPGGGGCNQTTCLTRAGISETNAAKSAAVASTVAFVAGAALAGTGLVLVLSAPSGGNVRVAPAVAPSYGGLSLVSAW